MTAIPSAASRTWRHGNHPAFLEREGTSPPFDPVHSETCEPNEKREQVAHGQQPDPATKDRIAQSPNANGPRHREPQNEIACEISRGNCRGGRNARGGNRPRQSVREQHAKVPARTDVADSDGPAQ